MAKNTQTNTGSVEDQLKALHQLQVIDTKVDKIRIIRGELPLEIQDLEDLIAGLNTRLEKFETELCCCAISPNKSFNMRIRIADHP